MSSTFFTASPHWRWLILAYFFLGGLAAGSYFLATLLDLFGKGRDRRLVHFGYLIAFPLVCMCGLVLTVDLGPCRRDPAAWRGNSCLRRGRRGKSKRGSASASEVTR